MKPGAVDKRQDRRCWPRVWVACAATFCLFSFAIAPDSVYAKERRATKMEKEEVRHDSIESDLSASRALASSARWRDASPRERRVIRDKARERWERASPRERRIFRRGVVGLRRALPELTEIERLVLLRNLFALPKDERRTMRRRLREIDRLPSDERKNFVQELRNLATDPSEEAVRIEHNVDRWRDLSESERDDYREQMRRFRSLSAEDRRRLLDEWENSPEARP